MGELFMQARDAETEHKMVKRPRDERQQDVAPNSRPESQKKRWCYQNLGAPGRIQNHDGSAWEEKEAMEGTQLLSQKPSTQSRYREATCVSFPISCQRLSLTKLK